MTTTTMTTRAATATSARSGLVRLGPRSPSVVRLALSVGCPSGIGPEVAVRAAATAGPRERILLVGDLASLRAAANATGVEPARLVRVDDPALAWEMPPLSIPVLQPGPNLLKKDRTPGKPTPRGGAAQLAWIDLACDLVSSGQADALVTGPASKESVASSSAPGAADFLGHTEHLQRRLGAPEVVMAFAARELTTALVTTHLPLSKVPEAITAEAVARACYWLVRLVAATRPTSKDEGARAWRWLRSIPTPARVASSGTRRAGRSSPGSRRRRGASRTMASPAP